MIQRVLTRAGWILPFKGPTGKNRVGIIVVVVKFNPDQTGILGC